MALTRYARSDSPTPFRRLPAAALRAALREGYGARDLKADVLSGMVVGVVALPLAMALGIAVGVRPEYGLYTAIVAGALAAALGGSRLQVTGPTAAFVVILAPISARFGFGGLLVSGLLAGLILTALGLFRVGRFIEFVPYPVTTGFTAGIAVVIAVLQVKDLLGLRLASNPDHFFDRIEAMWAARATASLPTFLVGAATLALLLLIPRLVTRKVPAPLLALPAAALLAVALRSAWPGAEIATIASRFQTVVGGRVFHGIPPIPPLPLLPWSMPGPDGQPFVLGFQTLRALLPGAFAIAMLGAIESLLSAVVADGMARTRHDPDAELLGQGIANVVSPFFGGIPATGAIARTATNVRSGGRSPIASIVHALTVLAAMLALAPLLGYLPMSALAALLCLVAWNMSEAKHFVRVVRVSPKSDTSVLLTCFSLTVVFDMVVGVSVGFILAAMLFMRRMAEVSGARFVADPAASVDLPIPPGVLVYDVSGALFFGAAQKAMAALRQTGDAARAVVIRMDQVHAMDATGLVALESALEDLRRRKVITILAGVRPQVRGLLERARAEARLRVRIHDDVAEGFAAAAAAVARRGDPSPDAAAG